VAHVVRVGVHASPDTTIAHFGWHQMIEAYLERSGLAYTHLHPTSFMQNLFLLARSEGPASGVITHYIGDARVSWIDAGDIAATAAIVLRDSGRHAGQTYRLGAETASMDEIASLMSAATRMNWRCHSQDPDRLLNAMTDAGGDHVYFSGVSAVFERIRDGFLPEASETFDTFERLAGRRASSLAMFIEKHASAFSFSGGVHEHTG
jgi:uncharacterized protein YbjT (DUF2867 family)